MRGIKMTYEEFLKGVDELGFKVGNHFVNLRITNVKNETVAYVHRDNVGEVDTFHYGFKSLEASEKLKLFDLCYQLAKTPLEKRESVKKYYLIHKLIGKRNNAYLHLDLNDGSFLTGIESVYINFFEEEHTKVQFTLAEVEEIKEKFGVTLEDWELVEVEE